MMYMCSNVCFTVSSSLFIFLYLISRSSTISLSVSSFLFLPHPFQQQHRRQRRSTTGKYSHAVGGRVAVDRDCEGLKETVELEVEMVASKLQPPVYITHLEDLFTLVSVGT